MARLVGVDIPRDKRIVISLTYIYGIGISRSNEILQKAGINPNLRTKELTEQQIVTLRDILKAYKLEGDLRRDIQGNIRRLMDIGSYRGTRLKKNLPCRGQRTKTNARTMRGTRKTVAGKKQAPTTGVT